MREEERTYAAPNKFGRSCEGRECIETVLWFAVMFVELGFADPRFWNLSLVFQFKQKPSGSANLS